MVTVTGWGVVPSYILLQNVRFACREIATVDLPPIFAKKVAHTKSRQKLGSMDFDQKDVFEKKCTTCIGSPPVISHKKAI